MKDKLLFLGKVVVIFILLSMLWNLLKELGHFMNWSGPGIPMTGLVP